MISVLKDIHSSGRDRCVEKPNSYLFNRMIKKATAEAQRRESSVGDWIKTQRRLHRGDYSNIESRKISWHSTR